MNANSDYEISTPNPDNNDNAGEYVITCTVSDGFDEYEFAFTITALFNEPPVNDAGSISAYEIEYYDTAASYKMTIGTHCTDPEGDALYEYIYFDGTSIESAAYTSLFTYDKSSGELTIDGDIRTHFNSKTFTYQMLYTCTDEYNPDNTIDTAFRIVIVNGDDSPVSSKSQPLIEMFYQMETGTYEFEIDETAFSDDYDVVSYAAVGTLNDDKIMDNTYELTATVSGTTVTLGNFYPHTNEEVQGGILIEGYIKASDVNGQSAYSRFVLLKIRKFHLLVLILFSL